MVRERERVGGATAAILDAAAAPAATALLFSYWSISYFLIQLQLLVAVGYFWLHSGCTKQFFSFFKNSECFKQKANLSCIIKEPKKFSVYAFFLHYV